MDAGPKTSAQITTREVSPPPKRELAATIRLSPRDAAEDAEWLNVTGWQGGGSVVDPLKKVGEGVYRTTEPIPVHDNWKVTLRLHKDSQVASLPIFMPADDAIPVKEVPASARIDRSFILDKENLQREQKKGVSGVLVTGAYLFVLLIALGLFASLAWGLARFARTTGKGRKPATAASVR
jgi:hypothetical protein